MDAQPSSSPPAPTTAVEEPAAETSASNTTTAAASSSSFDEQNEWNKISEIIDSFGSDIGATVAAAAAEADDCNDNPTFSLLSHKITHLFQLSTFEFRVPHVEAPGQEAIVFQHPDRFGLAPLLWDAALRAMLS